METAVTVYGPLRSATGAKRVTLEWPGGTVAEAIAAIVDTYPRAEPQLYDGDELRSSGRVTVDGERAGLEETVPADVADADARGSGRLSIVDGGSRENRLALNRNARREAYTHATERER